MQNIHSRQLRHLTISIKLILIGLTLPLLGTCTAFAEQSEIEFFEKKIRPVLVKHCYECHSSKSASIKGGLVLDSREGLLVGGDSGPSMTPGKPEESVLIESLKYEGSEMPPDGKLPDHVIRDFEQWIKKGAIDPRKPSSKKVDRTDIDWEAAREFWAFQPLPSSATEKPSGLSDEKQIQQISALIDQQLSDSLKQAGVIPNQIAPASERIRRLYFDLIGLPPSPEEVEQFTRDPSEENWNKIVKRLLASEKFGQHWGRHWLDVARYADSNGGDFNATHHNAWRYRDYVISSFNQDKPIDLFFQEQIAGDLMSASDDQDKKEKLIATGFLMLGPKMLSERDKEKLRFDVIDEQIDTFGKVFLGLSLGCARCHDHKFDPVPTHDYYALAGIFHGTQVLDGEMQQYVSNWKRRDLPVPTEHRKAIQEFEQKQSALEKELKLAKVTLKKEQKTIDRLQDNLNTVTVDNKQAKKIGDWTSSTFSPRFVGTDYIHDQKKDKGKKKVIYEATLKEEGKYQILLSYNGGSGRDKKVPVQISYSETVIKKFVNQSKFPKFKENYTLLEEKEFPANTKIKVTISTEGTTGYVIADAIQFVFLDPKTKDPSNNQQLAKAIKNKKQAVEQVKKMEASLASLKKNAPAPVPQAMAVQEREQCEDCAIRIRGEHENIGKTVPRGALKIISGENSKIVSPKGSGRLELAQWLTGPARSLAGRVYVNRIWMHLFGEGIVRSVDNFGTLGVAPSHPKLLDQLSLKFIENQWSQKQIIQAIVLSKAYQRSSVHQKNAYQKDPENSLFWKANRRPLSAEQLRDSFLVFQKRLNQKQGGSTVTHLGRLVVDNNKQANAKKTSDHADRRTVYQPVLRNQLDEIAQLFDFANPEMVVGKRAQTNVPAQALYLLNSKEVQQTAEVIVDRMFETHGEGSYSGLDELYLMLYARESTSEELKLIQKYIDQKLGQNVNSELVRNTWQEVVQAMLISTEFRYLE